VLNDYSTICTNSIRIAQELLQKILFPSVGYTISTWVIISFSRHAGLVLWQNFSRHISTMPPLANHAVIFSKPFPPCGYYYDLFSSCESITNFPLHSGNNLKRDMHANIGLHSIIKFKIQKINLNKTITHTCLIRH
jgi:hypothetical protein